MTEASRVQKMLNEQNAEIDRLKNRIEKLEAALRGLVVTLNSNEIPYMVRNRYASAVAEQALEGKE